MADRLVAGSSDCVLVLVDIHWTRDVEKPLVMNEVAKMQLLVCNVEEKRADAERSETKR